MFLYPDFFDLLYIMKATCIFHCEFRFNYIFLYLDRCGEGLCDLEVIVWLRFGYYGVMKPTMIPNDPLRRPLVDGSGGIGGCPKVLMRDGGEFSIHLGPFC